jgi:hypothetical protein
MEEKIMVRKEIKNFLKTKDGRKVFRRYVPTKNKQMEYDRIKSYLNPPKNVIRWIQINELFEKMLLEKNWDKKNV